MIPILVLVGGSLVYETLPPKQVDVKPYCTVGIEVHCLYETLQDCLNNRTSEESCQQNPEGK